MSMLKRNKKERKRENVNKKRQVYKRNGKYKARKRRKKNKKLFTFYTNNKILTYKLRTCYGNERRLIKICSINP